MFHKSANAYGIAIYLPLWHKKRKGYKMRFKFCEIFIAKFFRESDGGSEIFLPLLTHVLKIKKKLQLVVCKKLTVALSKCFNRNLIH